MTKRKSESSEDIARRYGIDVENVRALLAGENVRVDPVRKIEPPKDWREYRKWLATDIRREIEARADVLRREGERDPVRQAENEAAKQHGFANGPALNRWLRRNR